MSTALLDPMDAPALPARQKTPVSSAAQDRQSNGHVVRLAPDEAPTLDPAAALELASVRTTPPPVRTARGRDEAWLLVGAVVGFVTTVIGGGMMVAGLAV